MLRQLFKKSLYYFVTLVGGKLLTAVFFIFLARLLQPEKFGLITYFITIVQLISVLADFGLKSWYQKQMSKKHNQDLLVGILQWRLFFYGISVIIILLVQNLFHFMPNALLGAVLIALLLEGLVSVSDACYLAQQKSLRLGYKLIARNLLLFIALFFIKGPDDYRYFLCAYNLAIAIVLIFYFPWKEIICKNLLEKPPLINEAVPYAAIDSLGIIYGKADSLIIEKLKGASALGIYGAAYRYLDAFNLLPQALFHNLFPLAAQKNGISQKQLAKMVVLMSALGLIIAMGILILSNFLTATLLGESYKPAAKILRLMSPVIWLFFTNAPLNTIIQSSDYVKKYLPIMSAIVVLNLLLNFVLVPMIGIQGSVYAMLFCEVSLLIANLCLAKKIYEVKDF